MYPKPSQAVNNALTYFHPMHDPAYNSNRIAALQQQLHISTMNCIENTATSWSNLIIPYHASSANAVIAAETPRSSHSEEETDQRTREREGKQETKKKNPYSIEELLKKPDKRSRPQTVAYVSIQQPYGVFVENEIDNRKSVYSSVSPVSFDGNEHNQ